MTKEQPITGFRHHPYEAESLLKLDRPQHKLMEQVVLPWALRISPNGPILDIAAGQGIETKYLHERGINCVAAEASDLLTANGYAKARTVRANPNQLPFSDGVFAGVLFKDGLRCFPPEERAKLLQEMRRVTKEGGSVLITTEDYPRLEIHYVPKDAPRNLVDGQRVALYEDGPNWLELVNDVHLNKGRVFNVVRSIIPEEVIALAETNGFACKESTKYDSRHPFSMESRWIDTSGFILELVAA